MSTSAKASRCWSRPSSPTRPWSERSRRTPTRTAPRSSTSSTAIPGSTVHSSPARPTRRSIRPRRGRCGGSRTRSPAERAAIRIAGASHARIFEGLDPTRLAESRMPQLRKRCLEALTDFELSWTIVAYPDEEWASEALGEPDVERLWQALELALRLDHDDPAAAWHARADELARALRDPQRARLRRPALPRAWHRARGRPDPGRALARRPGETTRYGQQHIANLPTEEVFTSPDRNRAEGTVRSTKPLAARRRCGRGARGHVLGRRDHRGARRPRRRARRAELATDENAKHLGEVALVDTLLAGSGGRARLLQHAVRRERGLAHRLRGGLRVEPSSTCRAMRPSAR